MRLSKTHQRKRSEDLVVSQKYRTKILQTKTKEQKEQTGPEVLASPLCLLSLLCYSISANPREVAALDSQLG